MKDTILMPTDNDLLNVNSKEKEILEIYLKENYPLQIKIERQEATYYELLMSYLEMIILRKQEILNDILASKKIMKIQESPSSLYEASKEAFDQAWLETQSLIKDNFKQYEVA